MKFKSPPIHRTASYRAKAAYWGMLARCGNANGKNPSYSGVELRMTREEWLEWAIPRYDRFNQLYPNLSPNVSRFGDSGHYEIGNLKIVPLVVNRADQKRDTKHRLRGDGTKLCGGCQEIKAASEFYRKSRNPDKLDVRCKCCAKEYRTSYRRGRTDRTLNPVA